MALWKLTELRHFGNSSIYEHVPSAWAWEKEERWALSVFSLSDNPDIFQQVKVPNGRCQKASASQVVPGGRKSGGSMWPRRSHAEAAWRAHSEKSKPQTYSDQSGARGHYQNKALCQRWAARKNIQLKASTKGRGAERHGPRPLPSVTGLVTPPSATQRRKGHRMLCFILNVGIIFSKSFSVIIKEIIYISCLSLICTAFWKCFKIY